ncbi:MAG: histidine kinase [Usitatibacter sp.]
MPEVPVSFPASPGFLINDPSYAPFGTEWLRGITPARVGVFAACCFLLALGGVLTYLSGDMSAALPILWDRWVRSLAFAAPMFVLVIKTEIGTARWSPRARIGALVAAVVAGTAAYVTLRTGLRVLTGNLSLKGPAIPQLLVAYSASILFTGGLLTVILYIASRERDAESSLHRARLARTEIERQLVESRLNLLRAQIEPHFLFNSLASVKLLYQRDTRKGSDLLRNITDYLRDATSCARQREIRLGDEVALARTFLGIFEVRMGKRLQVAIDVPAELESALVPPLTIGTLVENAIKHGIGPRASGGAVRLTARAAAGCLVVGVHDNGVGFRARSGSGVGLGNIRARLETLFGSAGSLELTSNSDGGVTATLRLPHRVATP